MLSTSDFKKGIRLEYEGQPWIIEPQRSRRLYPDQNPHEEYPHRADQRQDF